MTNHIVDHKDKAQVGILFVHGIGEQVRGQTLVDYGEPLNRYLERCIRVRNSRARKAC